MSKLLNLVANTVIGLMFLSSGVAAAYDNSTSKMDQKELMCLARNIYFESGSEPENGKIAVGMVTINRTQHPSFPSSVCDVVKQKTVLEIPKEITVVKEVKTGWGIWEKVEQIKETKTIWNKITVCQFSWVCEITRKIKETDQRWIESMAVAQRLLSGEYQHYKEEMGELLYFHSSKINPRWKNVKRDIRIGNHIFYVEKSNK